MPPAGGIAVRRRRLACNDLRGLLYRVVNGKEQSRAGVGSASI